MKKRIFGAPTVPTPAEDDSDQEFQPAFVNRSKNARTNTYDLLETEGQSNGEEQNDDSGSATRPAADLPRKKKKKIKRTKKSNTQTAALSRGTNEGETDEVARCVREVNELLGAPAPLPPSPEPSADSQQPSFLRVRNHLLDVANEVRRKFDVDLVKEDNPNRNERRQWSRHTTITHQRQEWLPVRHSGLRMVLLREEDGVKYFSFQHSESYHRVQQTFFPACDTHDHDAVQSLLRQQPYHIDSLLQLATQQGMLKQFDLSRENIEKALFAMEHVMHPHFNYTSGNCRLEYKHFENRCFHIAVLKYVRCLYNSACHNTALELCKLLLTLDPTDPLAVILIIDAVALRARNFGWLVEVVDGWQEEKNVSLLPNMAFSHALCQFQLAHKARASTARADELLREAMQRFPSTVLHLLGKCGNKALLRELQRSVFFSHYTQDTTGRVLWWLTKLYAQRAWSAWKERRNAEWLERLARVMAAEGTCNAVPGSEVRIAAKRRQLMYACAPQRVLRHLIVLNNDKIPNLDLAAHGLRKRNTDPYPPEDSESPYNGPEARASPGDNAWAATDQSQSIFRAFMRSILPPHPPFIDPLLQGQPVQMPQQEQEQEQPQQPQEQPQQPQEQPQQPQQQPQQPQQQPQQPQQQPQQPQQQPQQPQQQPQQPQQQQQEAEAQQLPQPPAGDGASSGVTVGVPELAAAMRRILDEVDAEELLRGVRETLRGTEHALPDTDSEPEVA